MLWRRHKQSTLSGFIGAFNRRHRGISQVIYGVIALAMVLFAFWDSSILGVDHPALREIVVTRFAFTFPVLFLAVIASFDRRPGLRIDWHMTLVCLAVGICVIQMYFLFEDAGRKNSIDGLILFIVGVFFIPSMFPYQKLLVGFVTMSAYFLFLYTANSALADYLYGAVYLGLLNLVGTIHSFSFDHSLKLNYVNNKALAKLAHTDQLTGVDNRYHFDEHFSELLLVAKEQTHNIFLAIVDIDYFKKFNDRYGHLEGDRCLVEVSAALRSQCENELDQCIRFGGEEFILVKYGLAEGDIDSWCERIHRSVAALAIPHESSDVSEFVTVSIGAVVWTPDCPLKRAELMARADEALYQSKSSGRNSYTVV